jgi:hypothetical protein
MTKTIIFKDFPDFRPNKTPREMFKDGVFGSTYWRPIYSSITNKNYKNQHLKFPKIWWKSIPEDNLNSKDCDVSINKYKVKSGTSLEAWECSGWITKYDPYGWVQWYCNFYNGRRCPDDERQIKRWLSFAGPNGRFRKRLINMIKDKKTAFNDFSVSPVIRQGLLQWCYEITKKDYEIGIKIIKM